jgi:hypothetical protein
VPNRKVYNREPHPLSAHIPAYTRDVNGIKVRGAGNVYGKGGKGDVGELGQGLQEHRRRVGESMRKRDELLQEASRLWQKGNKKTRGGEVAFYFAERVGPCFRLPWRSFLNEGCSGKRVPRACEDRGVECRSYYD